jgi:hypothetical protein
LLFFIFTLNTPAFAEVCNDGNFTQQMNCLEFELKQKELELKQSWFSHPIIEQGIAQTLAIFGIIVGAYISWRKEKNKPIEESQVKAFNESMIESNFEYYLKPWRKTWKKLMIDKNTYSELDSVLVNSVWEEIPLKGTQNEIDEDDMVWEQSTKRAWDKAQRMNLHYITKIGSLEKYRQSIEELRYISKVRYYQKITEMLPNLISRAVDATMELPLKNNNISEWEKKSFHAVKILMIFSHIREHDDVLKIMIDSEIKRILRVVVKENEN